jgi:hypothetical protein
LPRRLALAQADDATASDVDGGEEVQGSYQLSVISYQLSEMVGRRCGAPTSITDS